MKKQINPAIKAHLIRGAFYLLLLVAVCAIPFALAQRNTASGKMSRTVPRSTGTRAIPSKPNSARVPALAPASAFRVPAPKLPNAKLIGRDATVASLLRNIPLLTYMALFWSAFPSLRHQITASRDALNHTAHFISSTQCGDAGPPNNVFGWGRLDLLAAVKRTTVPRPRPTPPPRP